MRDLNQAIQLDDGNVGAYLFRGMIWAERGRRVEAITDLETALELGLEPDLEQEAQSLLGELQP